MLDGAFQYLPPKLVVLQRTPLPPMGYGGMGMYPQQTQTLQVPAGPWKGPQRPGMSGPNRTAIGGPGR